MLLEQPKTDVHGPITPDEARSALSTGRFGEDAALKLVIQDAERAENFENQKQWIMGWVQASVLYQSPYSARCWEGTQIERANVPFFTVANATNSLVPQIMGGLFYENPPFIVQPRPGTRVQAARAVGAVLGYQLEDINFREELRLGAMNAVLMGTGIWKYGWETFTRERTVYHRTQAPVEVKNPLAELGGKPLTLAPADEEIEAEVITEYVDRPSFEHIVNLRHVLVDPGLNRPDIRLAKYVVHRQYLTFDDLDKLRDREGFKIPSRAKLLELFLPPVETPEAATAEISIKNPMWDARAEARYSTTTIDPFNQQLEVLERWDKDSCIMVLQHKLVICNEPNPYGKIPFLSVNWWDVPEAFWGLGLAKTIGSEQRLQQGITNTWLDNAALALNGMYVRVRGTNVPTQSIRIAPGKIVEVDKPDGFMPLKRLDPVPEAGQHLALSDARAEKISGANEASTQGLAGSTGHSNLARSSAGANLIAAGAGSRTADFVEKLANQVIVPFLIAAHEMDRAMLPESTLKYILSDELQHEYLHDEVNPATGDITAKGGDTIEWLNAEAKFSVLAAAKMQARRNMAQALPILTQFLQAPGTTDQLAIQGKKVDIAEIIRMFFVVSDWKNESAVVVDMSDEDKKRYEAAKQGALQGKLQGQMAIENQKFQQKQQLLDQENMGRAGRDVLRHAVEKQSESEGGPGGPAFGAPA